MPRDSTHSVCKFQQISAQVHNILETLPETQSSEAHSQILFHLKSGSLWSLKCPKLFIYLFILKQELKQTNGDELILGISEYEMDL